MKAEVFRLVLVACIATYTVAEPSCPPLGDTVVYIPHPTDCGKLFVCHLGNSVELSCPNGTFWNDAIQACDLPTNVICTPSTAESATTTTVPAFSTSTASAPSTGGKCPDYFDPSQEVFLPHADCTKFYVCTWGGVAVEQSCPPNLHWNQHLSFCDYPAQAGCVSASPEPATSPAPTAPTTPSTTPDGCPAVYDPNHQVYFPHADCSKYYICTYEGSKLEQNCPVGLHWSQALSYCERPELVQCTSLKGFVRVFDDILNV